MKAISTILGLIILVLTPVTAFAGWPTGKSRGPNRKPIANAGWDQTVGIHEMVVFDGSKSFDPDKKDKLTYEWNLVARPAGGTSNLINPQGERTCRLTPDALGAWVVRLEVYDGKLKSEPSVRVVRVKPASCPPLDFIPNGRPPKDPKPQVAHSDIAIADFKISGIYKEEYINAVDLYLTNNGTGVHRGPISIVLHAINHRNDITFKKTITEDHILIRKYYQTRVRLSSGEIPLPTNNTKSASIRIYTDPGGLILDSDRSNNSIHRHIFSVGDLLPHCNLTIGRKILVHKAYGGPSSRLKKGEEFIFDCRKGRKFTMSFRLNNFCSNSNSAELSFVFDWTHIKRDGKNRVLAKKILVNVSSRDYQDYTTKKLRIPLKSRFTREFTTFAILSHHDWGADVLFSSPVKILK